MLLEPDPSVVGIHPGLQLSGDKLPPAALRTKVEDDPEATSSTATQVSLPFSSGKYIPPPAGDLKQPTDSKLEEGNT